MSRIQASLLLISTTRTASGSRARAFSNWSWLTPMVTGSKRPMAAATATNARCAGLPPRRHTSGRCGHSIHVPPCGSNSPGMWKPSARGVPCSSRAIPSSCDGRAAERARGRRGQPRAERLIPYEPYIVAIATPDEEACLMDFLNLPERAAKPRSKGITHVLDKGLGPAPDRRPGGGGRPVHRHRQAGLGHGLRHRQSGGEDRAVRQPRHPGLLRRHHAGGGAAPEQAGRVHRGGATASASSTSRSRTAPSTCARTTSSPWCAAWPRTSSCSARSAARTPAR